MRAALLSWLQAHRAPLLAALGCLGCLLVGLALGRWGTPARVRVETRTVEKETLKTVEVVREVKVEAKAQAQAVAWHFERVRRTAPGGVVEEKTTADSRSVQTSQETQAVAHQEEKVRVLERTVEVTKVVLKEAARPVARLGALAGLQLAQGPRPAFGGLAEWSPCKHLWVGAWGLSVPAAGLSLALEW